MRLRCGVVGIRTVLHTFAWKFQGRLPHLFTEYSMLLHRIQRAKTKNLVTFMLR